MAAKILDGRRASERLLRMLAGKVRRVRVPVRLATVIVGRRYDSQLYVRLKRRAAERVGIATEFVQLPASISQAKLHAALRELSAREDISGILLQLPLPTHLNPDRAVLAIDPAKDIDGFRNKSNVVPPTIGAVLTLMTMAKPKRHGSVVILGRRSVFTEQLYRRLRAAGYRVVILTPARAIPETVRHADIVVSVLGRGPRLQAKHIKPGAVVIDVGIRKSSNGTVGDAEQSVATVARAVSPVPGGVGPLTVYWVLFNTYSLATRV